MMSQMFNDSVAPRHENMMAITDAISQNSYIIITMFHKSPYEAEHGKGNQFLNTHGPHN